MKVFQYVIFLNPKNDNEGPSERPRILVDQKTVLASSERQAGIIASRDIPEDVIDRLEEVEIVVRPF